MITTTLKSIPQKILVITLRHLGDVILTTPLISSLHHAYPNACIDILVYTNTAPILKNNPAINRIITVKKKPSFHEYKVLLKKLFRQYDLAVVTQTGDRPLIYSLFSSKTRISVVPEQNQKGNWKRYFFRGWVEFDDEKTHTVLQLLKLMDTINQKKVFHLTPPTNNTDTTCTLLPPKIQQYAVLHLYPLWTYKQWTLNGWQQIATYLLDKGINIVLTGGPDLDEINYVTQFQQSLPGSTINLAGKTSLAELADIIKDAQLFIGPDTGTTHLASATGTPIIAIYGPTNPVKWAPWPQDYISEKNPFKKTGSQIINNVHLIQGEASCVPCYLEGCDRHRQSRSDCLDTLPASKVIQAIDAILLQN